MNQETMQRLIGCQVAIEFISDDVSLPEGKYTVIDTNNFGVFLSTNYSAQASGAAVDLTNAKLVPWPSIGYLDIVNYSGSAAARRTGT